MLIGIEYIDMFLVYFIFRILLGNTAYVIPFMKEIPTDENDLKKLILEM